VIISTGAHGSDVLGGCTGAAGSDVLGGCTGAAGSDVLGGCTVHPNERDVVSNLSVTNTVTVNDPIVVGVPLITPVLELRFKPSGSPV
jgi:hypothetical protein